jgi:hypothetical protein
VTLEGRPVPRPPAGRGATPAESQAPPAGRRVGPEPRVALVDLLDRLLAGGVVVSGELTLSIADVDLVDISLRVLITSVSGQDVMEPPRYD